MDKAWNYVVGHLRSERNQLIWLGVMIVAVFSAYVHTLHGAVERGAARDPVAIALAAQPT